MATTVEIADMGQQLRAQLGADALAGARFDDLVDMYAVLVLTKGVNVTNEDVHNIWAIWAQRHEPSSPYIVPYSQLPQAVKDEDSPFARAIRIVSQSIAK